MRCLSCDKILNKFERTSKYIESGDFLDLCTRCRGHADLPDGCIVDNNRMYSSKEGDE